jgi:glycosyltransferase involved in cell wall biosynthesis
MKKLLFIIPEYSHGGTNKSLENLLSLIDKTKYQISVYCLYEDGGDYYKRIFEPYILKKSRLYYWLHDNVVTRKVMGLYNKLTKKNNFERLYKREVRFLQKKYNFDTVVAYQEGTTTMFGSYFTNVNKIAWIHFDYSMLKNKVNLRATKRYYDTYHRIVCVSRAAMESMLSVYPEYDDKAAYLYNTINTSYIKEQADDKSIKLPYSKNVFNILSIGRFVVVKNFHLIPEMVSRIKNFAQKPFCWYIMGAGVNQSVIEEKIKEHHVENYVKLIQTQENPYPFFKQADIHICLSAFESFSYTLAEAKILHTPVLSNNFPVAYEVVDNSCGWIANIEEMPQLLARIINNENGEYDKKKATVMKYEYSNQTILQKIDELFEN